MKQQVCGFVDLLLPVASGNCDDEFNGFLTHFLRKPPVAARRKGCDVTVG